MKTEYEVKVLDINVTEIKNKLKSLNATLIGEFDQKRYVYDFNPKKENSWIRLRTNGKKTTLTIKEIHSDKIDGTKELEVECEDFETTNQILNKLGYLAKGYQENKRIQYKLDGIEVDIDFWPKLPAFLEVEGNNEDEVKKALSLLELQNDQITSISVTQVYEKYNIDIEKNSNLHF
ncbi:class IV adenylate cyclase [Candidatus Woesearchaeota archaeon]|nr:class IV adenylate cyclase [Candidatus Woesearchaeota archaeon]